MAPKLDLGIDPIKHPFTHQSWTSWDISQKQSKAYFCIDQKLPLCSNSSLSQWHFKPDSFVYLSVSTNDTIQPLIVSLDGSLLNSNHTKRNYTCGFRDLDSICHFQLDSTVSPGLYSVAVEPNDSFLLYMYIDPENTTWPLLNQSSLTHSQNGSLTISQTVSQTVSHTLSTSITTSTITSSITPIPLNNSIPSGTIQPNPHAYLHSWAWIFSLILFFCGCMIILGLFIEKNFKERKFRSLNEDEGFA